MKIFLNFSSLIVLLFVAQIVFAQTDDPYHIEQTGKLFTIKIVPGDRTTSFYIVGKEAARLKLKNLVLDATLFLPHDESKRLKVNLANDKFVVDENLAGKEVELKIHDKASDKSDEFHIKLESAP